MKIVPLLEIERREELHLKALFRIIEKKASKFKDKNLSENISNSMRKDLI